MGSHFGPIGVQKGILQGGASKNIVKTKSTRRGEVQKLQTVCRICTFQREKSREKNNVKTGVLGAQTPKKYKHELKPL